MGVIMETPYWGEGIYRIRSVDPLQGGADGITNIQPTQLAQRTRYLRELLAMGHDAHGGHAISGDMLVEDAGLVESKLDLPAGTREIAEMLDAGAVDIEQLRQEVLALVGDDSQRLRGLVRSLLIYWGYSDFSFAHEGFSEEIILRHMPDRQVIGAVRGDDSITCDDHNAVPLGCRVLLYNDDTVVEVTPVKRLDCGRVLLSEPLGVTFPDCVLSHTNWQVEEGYAIGQPGQVYISSRISQIAEAPRGMILVSREEGEGGLDVFYRNMRDGGEWQPLTCQGVTPSILGTGIDERYTLEGCDFQLKIVVSGDPVLVRGISIFPQQQATQYPVIKTPQLIGITSDCELENDDVHLQSTPYRNKFGDPMSRAEYRILSGDAIIGHWEFSETGNHLLEEASVPREGLFDIQCRHVSDIGDVSDWSTAKNVTIKFHIRYFGFLGHHDARPFGTFPLRTFASEPIRFGFDGAESSDGFGSAYFITE